MQTRPNDSVSRLLHVLLIAGLLGAAGADADPAPLHLTSVSRSSDPDALIFRLPTTTGMTYFAEESFTLEDGSWQAVHISMEGDGTEQTLAIPLAGPEADRFFRIAATPTFKLIPAGDFLMGDQSAEDGFARELPVHRVELGAFSIQATEVTKAQWDVVYNAATSQGYTFDNRGSAKGPRHPVHTVNWHDVVKWCNALSEQEGLQPCYTSQGAIYRTGQDPDLTCDFAKNGYRLPTEAEWEKAARGGLVGKRFPWGDLIDHTHTTYYAQFPQSPKPMPYDVNSRSGLHPAYETGARPFTAPVGSFAPNGYGLYDMTGNLWEWCWDWFSADYYSSSPDSDPYGPGPDTMAARIFRGGSWTTPAISSRTSHRGYEDPNSAFQIFGFRIARTVNP